MKVEQMFTGCLAEMAYFIESNGEAAIIDPLRETEPYIEMAAKHGAIIKYIFLTHFHADFVSGQVDLANKTGARIIFGPNAEAEYNFYLGKDGEEFKFGGGKITLLHTPGHTMESSSYLITDENGQFSFKSFNENENIQVRNLGYATTDSLLGAGNNLTLSLDPTDLVEHVLNQLTRSLSERECRTYRIDPCPTLEDIIR